MLPTQLDMMLASQALDMFATQTRDLSHIEWTRSGNISSSSIARTYRVSKADISTEEKQEQEQKDFLLLFLLFYVCNMS